MTKKFGLAVCLICILLFSSCSSQNLVEQAESALLGKEFVISELIYHPLTSSQFSWVYEEKFKGKLLEFQEDAFVYDGEVYEDPELIIRVMTAEDDEKFDGAFIYSTRDQPMLYSGNYLDRVYIAVVIDHDNRFEFYYLDGKLYYRQGAYVPSGPEHPDLFLLEYAD